MTQAVEATPTPEQAPEPEPQQEAEQQLTVRSLLEAGVHIGHPTKRWHPKMQPYIYQKRQKIHILNPQITLKHIEIAAEFVTELTSGGGSILFVGTKKQAEIVIAEEAVRCGSMYVNRRWLGGLMTNFQTIQTRIDYLVRLEESIAKGELHTTTKREAQRAATEVRRLNNYLGGIKTMTKLPDAIYVVDIIKESIAIAEAKRLGIKIVAMVDTNCDPTGIDYLIPSNDDASRAISIITRRISNAVLDGHERHRVAEEERLAAETEIEELEAQAREAAQTAAAARHAEAAAAAAAEAESATESKSKPEAKATPEPEAEAAPEPEPGAKANPEPEAEAAPEPEPEAEATPELEAEAALEPEPEARPTPELDAGAAQEPEAEPESDAKMDAEPSQSDDTSDDAASDDEKDNS